MKQGDKNSLPEGWEMKKLGEVLKIQNGYAFNAKLFTTETGTPLIRIRDIKKGIDTETKFNGLYDRKYEVNAGDFLIGMDGEFGCYEWKGDLALLNQRVCRLQNFSNRINSRFLFYGINKYLKAIEEVTSFATVKHISSKQIEAIKMPLPPIEEQQRIVVKLDEAFEAIEKANANTKQNLKNAKELFESYLQAIFENKGKDWEEKTLKDLTSKIGSGATPRGGNASYKTSGISLIRSMNVHDLEFRERNLAFIDGKQASDLNNVTVEENDILFNITGASVTRCCVVLKQYLPARVNQHVSIVRVKKEIIEPNFLNLLLVSKCYKDQLLFTGEQGATRQAITKAQLENFMVSFPKSIAEQQTIVQKLDALSAETKKLEAIYQKKLEDLEELKKSILQKAFTGQL
ncbi:MAG: restriction endonuclease subunit S [Parabacteroides sp.]|nr:restriction endonuclease subunit S [Parabacteroides sp.]